MSSVRNYARLFAAVVLAGPVLLTCDRVARADTVAQQDNSGLDQTNYATGGWTLNGSTTVGDNTPGNDNYSFGLKGYLFKSPYGANNGTTAGPGYFGVGKTSSGNDISLTWTANAAQSIEPYRPVLWEATVRGYNSDNSVDSNGNPIPYASKYTASVNIGGTPVGATQSVLVSNNAYAASPTNGTPDIAFDGTRGTATDSVTTKYITSGWQTGFTATAGTTPIVLNYDMPANNPSSTLDKRMAAGIGQIKVIAAAAGDANLDRTVNSSDISQIISHGFYNDGLATHTWADGDFNGDGTVNSSDISQIISEGKYNSGTYALSAGKTSSATHAALTLAQSGPLSITSVGVAGDGVPDYEYISSTGHLIFHQDGVVGSGANSTEVGELRLLSAGNRFLTANSPFTGGFDTNTTGEQDGLRFPPSQFADGFDLGAILPTGLTQATLLSDLTLQYTVGGGPSRASADLLAPTPEPSALALLALGGIGLLRRRRSRQ